MSFVAPVLQIGCQKHTVEEWAKISTKQIAVMDGKDGLAWWTIHGKPLLAICKGLMKAKGGK